MTPRTFFSTLPIVVFCCGIAFVMPAYATLTCLPGTYAGVTFVTTSPSYDAIVPSGQTYARTVAFVAYPTGQMASGNMDIAVLGTGKAWSEQSNLCATAGPLAAALVQQEGWAVYAFYTTWASAGQVAAAHNVGDKSFTVEALSNSWVNIWWPNATCSVDGCSGISTPFSVVYGSAAAGDQETLIVTSQSGSGLVNGLTGPMKKTHSANEYAYNPKTQYPASVADYTSAFNWIGSNAGSGTYPGNAQRIHVFGISSDAHGLLMASLLPHDECLVSCADVVSYWGSSVGNNGGSSNPASSWQVVSATNVGVPWDLNYMFDNSGSGGGNIAGAVQSVIPTLMGCVPGTDPSCTADTRAASPASLLSSTSYQGVLLSASGGDDFTTPPCPYLFTWGTNIAEPTWIPDSAPCTGNMYEATDLPFVVWLGTGIGHGGDCAAIPSAAGQCFTWALAGMTNAAGGSRVTAPTNGLSAYWPFDETSGIIADDMSGNSNSGRLQCATNCRPLPEWTPGIKNGALAFTAPSDLVSVPDSPSLRLRNNFTMAFWLKNTAAAINTRYISKGTDTMVSGFVFAAGNAGTNVFLDLFNNGAVTARCIAATVIPSQVWEHLAVTYDGSEIRFYVNGLAGPSCSASGTAGTNASPLNIGGGNQADPNSVMDEVRIYNRALSAQEIAAVYEDPGVVSSGVPTVAVEPMAATLSPSLTMQFRAAVTGNANSAVTWSVLPATGSVSTSGLYRAPDTIAAPQTVTVTATSVADPAISSEAQVTLSPQSIVPLGLAPVNGLSAYWPFDETSGTIAYDLSGNSNAGRLQCSGNCTPLPEWTAGRRNGALALTAPDDFISVPDSPTLRLTNNFTIALWLKKAAGAANVSYISKGTDTLLNGFVLASGNTESNLYLNLFNKGLETARCVADGVLLDQVWEHLAVTYDGSEIRFYVNGLPGPVCGATGIAGTSASPLLIGGVNQPNSDGTMDEVRIYNRALSAEEIAGVYDDPGVAPPL